MIITTSDFTAKGNAVGFTSDAAQITIRKRQIPNVTEWQVTVGDGFGDERSRTFASKTDAASYASRIVDEAKTDELAWWS